MPFAAFSLLAAATLNATPADAVSHYAQAIAASDPTELAKAFQPSAIMYCANGEQPTAKYQAQWKASMAGAAPPSPVSTKTEWVEQGRTGALARLISVRGKITYTDYLLLARLDTGWRIVGKLCEPVEEEMKDARTAVGGVVDTKLRADRRWDDDLLGRSIDARSLVMTVDGGEMVAATPAEWQARYRDRKKTSAGSVFNETSRVVDAGAKIGVARWSFHTASGDWTDRALVMQTPNGWRMMALLFVNEKP